MRIILPFLMAMLFSASIAYTVQQSLHDMYRKMTTFHVADSFPVQNLSITRGTVTLHFDSGEITIVEGVNGRYHAAFFTGQGTFRFRPPNAIEADQLHKFTGTRIL